MRALLAWILLDVGDPSLTLTSQITEVPCKHKSFVFAGNTQPDLSSTGWPSGAEPFDLFSSHSYDGVVFIEEDRAITDTVGFCIIIHAR